MRRALVLALVCVLFAAVSSPLFAQQVTGTIKGVVTDPSGATIANATVDIINKATGLTRTVTTNDQGEYSAPDLPFGVYRVSVSRRASRSRSPIMLICTCPAAQLPTLSVDHSRKLGVVGLHLDLIGLHGDRLGCTSQLKDNVGNCAAGHVQINIIGDRLLEARLLDADPIDAKRQIGSAVFPLIIRGDGSREAVALLIISTVAFAIVAPEGSVTTL